VWVADAFQGLPRPDPERWPAEEGDEHWTQGELAVPLEEVQANFARYGLLDEGVRFLVGWLADTLPAAPIERLAVLRLDGDMYGSTMEALEALYPKLSVGGYVIIDDYGAIPRCKEAVTDFRAAHGIIDPMESVDWTGVYWQRS
jgi:O-methyltransferase